VKCVELIRGQKVDVLLNKGNRKEMAAHVEHGPAPPKCWLVGDAHVGQFNKVAAMLLFVPPDVLSD
jgi:hypothetical protein